MNTFIWIFVICIPLCCMFTFIDTKGKSLTSDHVESKRDYSELPNRDPCRGMRQRKEVRQMSQTEWNKFTRAINILKRQGKYTQIAAMHRGKKRLDSAHKGANFLGWHRIYLYIFEELLREVEPCLTIPYWDSTMDYDMVDPKKSVLWTGTRFGNGDYQVVTGPFANWVTGTGNNLTRNIGNSGTLMTKEGVAKILSRTNHTQITDSSDAIHNLEANHNGVHAWVDGQLGLLNEAAEDPVFFLHHAFIDCIWYWFQEKIFKQHGTNSYYDYPIQRGSHGPIHKMDPFSEFTPFAGISNRDGYNRKYYKGLYTCKPMPSCSLHKPSCNSEHLTCDLSRNRCVSKEIKFGGFGGKIKMGPPPAIPRGEKFVSNFVDPRARGNPLPQTLPDTSRLAETTSQIKHNINLNSIPRL